MCLINNFINIFFQVYFMQNVLNIIIVMILITTSIHSESYKIVDSGQDKCFDNSKQIVFPVPGQIFYGQDAQHEGNQPSYSDNGDGTITDNITGLMWQKSPDFNSDGNIDYEDKMTYSEAVALVNTFSLAGYNDWRLPTIKELYSLFMAYGTDPSAPNPTNLIPFLDTEYFPFGYGDESNGERQIDAQYATSTIYTGKIFQSQRAMFGVNFADGRIKGYPPDAMPNGKTMKYYVKYVRGDDYGKNDFINNNDGTILDNATNLMWTKDDSKVSMNWQVALDWVQQMNSEKYLGYEDWRLPNVKELQSIVDYSLSPQVNNKASIDPIFNSTEIVAEAGNENYPFYWTSTTHISAGGTSNGNSAMYVCFGDAYGFMEMPPGSGNRQLMDVHGAGAQRSDFKIGDPANYPDGHGPQGDVIRINNYVRLVRDAKDETSVPKENTNNFQLYPNPSSDFITIQLSNKELQLFATDDSPSNKELQLFAESEKVHIFDVLGIEVGQSSLIDNTTHNISQSGMIDLLKINIYHLPAGVYFIRIGNRVEKFVKM